MAWIAGAVSHSTDPRRRIAALLLVAAAAGIYMLRVFAADSAGPLNGEALEGGGSSGSPPLSASFIEAVEALEIEQGRLGVGPGSNRSRHAGDSSSAHGSRSPAIGSLQWDGGFRRADIDLAYLMISGQYEAWNLVRHPSLNPADRVMPPDERRELSELVARLKSASALFRREADKVAAKDRIAEIDAGRVAPVDEPPLTEAERNARTARIVNYFERRGESISTKEAAEKLERGEVWALDRPLASGQTWHQGKVYDHNEFASLPEFGRIFEGLRYIAMQELGVLVAWFETNAYTAWSPELHEVMSRLQTMSLREMVLLARDAGRSRR